jgi:hypothetical protein
MAEFYETKLGRKFYEHDVPELVASINRLAAVLEGQTTFMADAMEAAQQAQRAQFMMFTQDEEDN